MGDYTNAIDLRKLFKKIDTANLNDNDLEFYITMAESVVKGKIAKRYDVTFSAVPPLIRYISAELSLIFVLNRFFTGETRSKNDWRDVRKQDNDKLLNDIADGKIALTDSSGNIIAQRTDNQGIESNTKDYTPTFSHLDVEDQKLDKDREDDERDDLD